MCVCVVGLGVYPCGMLDACVRVMYIHFIHIAGIRNYFDFNNNFLPDGPS